MNYRAQMLCAWMGPLTALVIGVGLWPLMHFLPPLQPTLTTAQLADFYRTNQIGVLVGGIFMMFGASFLIPFFAALAMQMKRMEDPSRLWTWTFLLSGLFGFVPLLVAEMMFSTAAYRPERSPEVIQAISDFGFIIFVGPSFPGVVQFLAIALAILGDRNVKPVFPRWTGYFNVWMAILTVPGAFVTLFKVGPFAWNGVLAFWVAASAFFVWVVVNFWALRRAILTQMHADKVRA
jgi:hypothetical protein